MSHYLDLVSRLVHERNPEIPVAAIDHFRQTVETLILEYVRGDFVLVEPHTAGWVVLVEALLAEHDNHEGRVVVISRRWTDEGLRAAATPYHVDLQRTRTQIEGDTGVAALVVLFEVGPGVQPQLAPGGYLLAQAQTVDNPSTGDLSLEASVAGWDTWRRNYNAAEAQLAAFRREYREKYRMNLHAWSVYHQRDIVYTQPYWQGKLALKQVLDAWVYQEVLYEVKPDVVVEIGSHRGGTTLFLAHMCDLMGKGKVISIDIDRSQYDVQHERIVEITGDSSSDEVLAQVRQHCEGQTTLIIHDGDHSRAAVLRELNLYAPLVTVGSYFIVEDGNVDLYPYTMGDNALEPWMQGDGPLWAVSEFLVDNPNFERVTDWERYLLTYNPCGFLRRNA